MSEKPKSFELRVKRSKPVTKQFVIDKEFRAFVTELANDTYQGDRHSVKHNYQRKGCKLDSSEVA